MWTDRDSHGFNRQRLRTTSYMASIASITRLHFETLNIWSHLLGTVWFCSSLVCFAADTDSLTQDAAAVLLYLGGTSLCFASSTLYHIFADHAHASWWQLVDHLGIVGAIWASSISFALVSFDCRGGERWMFVVLVSSAAALCLRQLVRIHSHSLRARRMRLNTHIVLGALAILPALRAWHLRSEGHSAELLEEFGWLFLTNIVGGGIYASHLLDKAVGMDMGMPDASHHVMHVLTVAGAWVYERGVLSMYQTRTGGSTGLCM